MSDPVLQASGLEKSFLQGSARIIVLDGVDLSLQPGEKVAVIGRSGSGKSTLLHLLAGLDTPDAGSVRIAGTDLVRATNNQRAGVRNRHMGFVYQNHHLLAEFTALENVAMPLRIAGQSAAQALESASRLLAAVGLAARETHTPDALSGGERQRVAVARAIAGTPSVVLADEPTGNLDSENARQVMSLLHELGTQHGTACIVVTHDPDMLDQYDRVLHLTQGRLVDDG